MKATIIILVIFFILIFQMPITIDFYTNAIKNKGNVTVKLFGFLPVFSQTFRYSAGFIEFFKNPKKIKRIKVDLNPTHIKNTVETIVFVLNCEIIRRIKLKTIIGTKDSFVCAMINGGLSAIISVLSSINLTNGNILSFENENLPLYNKSDVEIYALVGIKLSILDAIFMIFLINKKKVKV